MKGRREKWEHSRYKDIQRRVSQEQETPASARGDGGTGQQIRGPEGPEYSVPEEAALLTEWMMPCRA